jgi:hypothetical protein
MPTLQEKYDFLCSKMTISSVDVFECDALLILCPEIYYQFSVNGPGALNDIDHAVVLAMATEKSKPVFS